MKKHIIKFFKIFIPIIIFQYFILQTSKVEGVSMQGTFYEDDIILVSLLSYGLPIPYINQYSFYDLFEDDHIIKGEGPNRGDVITIKHNKKNKIEHYIKRMVAKDGDELIFTNNKLYIYTKEVLNANKKNILGKIWFVNPYKEQYRSVNTYFTDFKRIKDDLIYKNYKGVLKPIYIKTLGKKDIFKINNKKYNAFYYKVPKNKYFVMGDNVDMSTDSRVFGAIPYKDIIGKVVATIRL